MFYPQRLEGREELEVSCIEGRFKILQEQATEQTGENTHGQKEIRSGGNPTGTRKKDRHRQQRRADADDGLGFDE